MKIELFMDRCCGAGMCVLAAPSVFGQSDETGLVEIVGDADLDMEGVRQAFDMCPSQTIALIE